MKNLFILSVLVLTIICWSLETKAFWENVFSDNTEKEQTINDRKRLVELEVNTMIEVIDTRIILENNVKTFNELSKRKKCIEDKNKSYSQGKTFEEVSKFVCNDDYKKAKVVFQ